MIAHQMFEQLCEKLEQLSDKFEQLSDKFEQVSGKVELAERKFEELSNKFQEVCAKLDSLSSSPSQLASAPHRPPAATSPSTGILAEALRGLVGMVMHAVQSSETPAVEEQDLVELLKEPLQGKNVALAYDMVRRAVEGGPNIDNAKLLLRIIRDLLVLLVCGGSTGPWDNARLQAAMNEAFGKEVDEQAMSQLVLTFNKILDYGKDRAQFDIHITAKAYGEPLGAKLADQIFAVYAKCAHGSPQYVSKAKKTGKFRPGKRSDRDRSRSASPAKRSAATRPAQQWGEVGEPQYIELQYNLSTEWQWPALPWYQLVPPPGLQPPPGFA